ncbi:MAG: glycosyltransferase [Candidatus Cloacimonetes bacterium]|nr:glycosyltransferase [Candidatus Cloacimonadota bacterium]
MDKRHILIYGHEFPNPIEPVRGLFIHRNLEYLAKDYDIKVVAPVPWFLNWRKNRKAIIIPYKDTIDIDDRIIDVYRPRYLLFPKNIFRLLIGWFEYILTFKAIKSIHMEWKIDLIHVNFAQPDGIAVRHICKRLEIPYIMTEHHGIIGHLLQSRCLRKQILNVYCDSAKTIVVSEFTKNQIEKYSSHNFTCEVIPNGVQVERFTVKDKNTEPRNLVYIGNLIHSKGIHILIIALSVLKEQNLRYRLSVIGDGKYKDELVKLTKSLNVESYVTFFGAKSSKDIDRLLPEHDILILPSFVESFSIVLIEAMAAGLPVIATKCGGPELIVTEETGSLITPNSVNELVDALVNMIKNWDKYNPDNIRNYVSQRYDIRIVNDRISMLYKEVLNTYE